MTPGTASDLPRAFGNYLLFDRIGRGGMAEIFLARARDELGGARRLVVKEVLPELSRDPSFARMLVREAKLAARLSHRNVVQVTDLGRESGRLFIAMEYVEGYDLNQLLRQLSRQRLPLPAEFALFIVREVLAALDYAHRVRAEDGTPLGIVHRDVSPSNVLISFEGEVSLCDFGIARAMGMDVRKVRAGDGDPDESQIQRVRVAGKSAYMAPEHARGEMVDARSDIFAAGILLWELCAGRRLYRGTEQEMLELARKGEVPALPDRVLPAHAQLQAVLDRALKVDPAARYQSAREMLEALEEYTHGVHLMASPLRFGTFLTDHFADEILSLRRARERAAELAFQTLDIPITEIEPVTVPSEPPYTRPSAPPSQPVVRLEDSAAAPASVRPGAGGAWWLLVVAAAAAAVAWRMLMG